MSEEGVRQKDRQREGWIEGRGPKGGLIKAGLWASLRKYNNLLVVLFLRGLVHFPFNLFHSTKDQIYQSGSHFNQMEHFTLNYISY